ncbi:hypothetical protein FACS189496_4640 [Bacilli bacterium]|nr:hypothetical protein FACS189496_4610 [Bacilli bacterium]GHU53341.1 hypothetical protein FACS189496_4640 [Bacilli bacterium]
MVIMTPVKEVNAYIEKRGLEYYLIDGSSTRVINNPFITQVGKKKFKKITLGGKR